jgi:NADP-dependent 3-hydroxy acid dehydrogenase YdfG
MSQEKVVLVTGVSSGIGRAIAGLQPRQITWSGELRRKDEPV